MDVCICVYGCMYECMYAFMHATNKLIIPSHFVSSLLGILFSWPSVVTDRPRVRSIWEDTTVVTERRAQHGELKNVRSRPRYEPFRNARAPKTS